MNDEKNFQKAGEERMNDKADLFCSTSEHSGRHNTRIIRNDHVIVKKKKIKSLEQQYNNWMDDIIAGLITSWLFG